jgi:hypothetical protein
MKKEAIPHGIVDDLLINGIITESTSAYAGPGLQKKKRFRRQQKYVRRLQTIQLQDKYPLPLVEDQLIISVATGKVVSLLSILGRLTCSQGSIKSSVGRQSHN